MTLARFALLCTDLGATRPPIPDFLSTHHMIFRNRGDADTAGEVLQLDDHKLKFNSIRMGDGRQALQLVNPEDR